MSQGWGEAPRTPRLEENKRRIMQSSIFGDDPPPRQQQPVERSPNRPPPQQNPPMYSPEKQYRPMNQNDPAPSNYSYQPVAVTPINAPKFDGLVTQSNVPSLSAFPEVNIAQISTPDSFNFDLKPRTPLRQSQRSLQFKPNAQLKVLRDSIEDDMKKFTQRISHLNVNEPIEIKDAFVPSSNPQPKKEEAKLEPSKAELLKRQKAKVKKEKLPPPEYMPDPVPHDMNNSRPLNNSTNMNLSSSMGNSIGFTTHSEFIMPDGSSFQ
ncbi:hypothetical protein TVAG_303340 [Trichomonas vaginalis G3]|uniref:Uncharacterized protein n=1 Tax=Trichomonas vaginalis (strain ATCC PRA-98 / G3) TaxID=412133 RepID=A2DR16_TRIV3|nr:hypothetical protein TVAGG3_0694560 [Trichomonas vaginalis G3]EAY17115.1 hypothetical protein TVAG_303340 [Trichomonas vaginalis G3]KAI5508825.1 hypothetical protein TVAGG3_0694560 [Trichomonas vaginalis G3]|eukprot:XP_001329338.1 hypothetical protein [Trichomonas vaginalis G3]